MADDALNRDGRGVNLALRRDPASMERLRRLSQAQSAQVATGTAQARADAAMVRGNSAMTKANGADAKATDALAHQAQPVPPPTWESVTGKPDTFPASTPLPAHTHEYSTLSGLPLTFAPSPHTHAFADLTARPATYPPDPHTHAYSSLTGIPAAFAPSSHTHALALLTATATVQISLAVGVMAQDVAVPIPLGADFAAWQVSATISGVTVAIAAALTLTILSRTATAVTVRLTRSGGATLGGILTVHVTAAKLSPGP